MHKVNKNNSKNAFPVDVKFPYHSFHFFDKNKNIKYECIVHVLTVRSKRELFSEVFPNIKSLNRMGLGSSIVFWNSWYWSLSWYDSISALSFMYLRIRGGSDLKLKIKSLRKNIPSINTNTEIMWLKLKKN